MSIGTSITIGSRTKFMYIRTEGNFEGTGLLYIFEVDLL